ncbi:MAG TPA: hypothetical protein VF637_18700 [Sphingomicrobium sp.]
MIVAALAVQQAVVEPSKDLMLRVAPAIAATSRSGIEIIQLVVSPTGIIVACNAYIVGRGRFEDRENCNKMVKQKATPATDQDGRKLYGTSKFLLTWTVDSAAPPPAKGADLYLPVSRLPLGWRSDMVSFLTLVAGADGKVETCAVQGGSGFAVLDTAACRAVTIQGVAPIRDGAGAAVRAVHNLIVGFTARP